MTFTNVIRKLFIYTAATYFIPKAKAENIFQN